MHRGLEIVYRNGAPVDKDRAEGTVNEISGGTKRQAGERTGNTEARTKGIVREMKGNAQTTGGGMKDAMRAAREQIVEEQKKSDIAGY
jgi:uncharacterized protein YjbJ (UPF0337 family)